MCVGGGRDEVTGGPNTTFGMTEAPAVSVSLLVSMVVEGSHGNRGLLPASTSVRFLNLPALPMADTR